MRVLHPRAGPLYAAAALLVLLAPSGAVSQQPPAGATALCGDGSYSHAASKRGACSGHGGIKVWYADQRAAAKAAPVGATPIVPAKPAVVVPAGATGVCGDGTYTSAKSARGACSGHGGVKSWITPPGGAPTTAAQPLPPLRPSAGPAAQRAANVPASAANATALCNDGTYSMSQHRGGTCSRHGGVKQWLKNVPN